MVLTAKFIYGLIRGEGKTEGNMKSESGKGYKGKKLSQGEEKREGKVKDVQPWRLVKECEAVWEKGGEQEGGMGSADVQHDTKETVTQFGIEEVAQFTLYGHTRTGQLVFCVCLGYDCNFVCRNVWF